MVGIVDRSASPYEIAKSAIEDATYMCARTHGEAPDVTIHGRLDLNMATIPNYVQYILVELLKNSMRATVEFHGVENTLPPIKVIIADGEDNEDVVSASTMFLVGFLCPAEKMYCSDCKCVQIYR